MGKAFQGVYGSFVNKVGNVVGRVKQGVQIYSIYQPSVANPRTPEQVANRSKFGTMTSFVSKVLAGVKVGFQKLDGYRYGTAFSSCVGYNMKNGVVVSDGQGGYEIDYSKMAVSEGQLDNAFNMQGSVDSNTLTLTWADNSGMGNALATDVLEVVIYNKTKKAAVFDNGNAVRSSRNSSVTIPTAWNGDSIEVWAFFNRKDNSLQAKTQYIGSFSV